jgi:hypothetical protein
MAQLPPTPRIRRIGRKERSLDEISLPRARNVRGVGSEPIAQRRAPLAERSVAQRARAHPCQGAYDAVTGRGSDAPGFNPAHYTRVRAIAREAMDREVFTRRILGDDDDNNNTITDIGDDESDPILGAKWEAARLHREHTLDDIDGSVCQPDMRRSVSIASTIEAEWIPPAHLVHSNDEEIVRVEGEVDEAWFHNVAEMVMHD